MTRTFGGISTYHDVSLVLAVEVLLLRNDSGESVPISSERGVTTRLSCRAPSDDEKAWISSSVEPLLARSRLEEAASSQAGACLPS